MTSFAQAPPIQWQKSYGGSGFDEIEKMIVTSDGGFVMVGWSTSNDFDFAGLNPGGSTEILVVKTDAIGNILWKKTIGGSDYEDGLDIKQTTDGGYVICGHTSSDNGDFPTTFYGSYDAFVAKLDGSGNLQWLKGYGGSDYDVFVSIEQTADGGYICAGYTGSYDHDVVGIRGDYDAWVVKLDATGIIQWQKCIGGSERDVARSIKLTSDGGYIFAGYSRSTDLDISGAKGGWDVIVAKLDALGNLVWTRNYGGAVEEWTWDLVGTVDGGFVIAAHGFSSDGDLQPVLGMNDWWILKIDEQGNILWKQQYGGSDYEDPYAIDATVDGGVIIVGRTRSVDGDIVANRGENDAWVMKLDVNGAMQWQKTMGGSEQDIGHAIRPTPDGGYIVGVTSHSADGDLSLSYGKTDIWVVKLGVCAFSTPAIPASINGLATPCVGSTVKYTINPVADATGYTWSLPGSWTIVSGQGTTEITVIVGGSDGNLNVLAYNSCSFSAKQVLGVTPVAVLAPQITLQASATNGICKGTNVSFTATTLNTSLPSFQWKKNNLDVGSNHPTYADNNLRSGDVITCVVTSQSACGSPVAVTSAPISVQVVDPVTPVVKISGVEDSVCAGQNITYAAIANNAGNTPSYNWMVNGVDVNAHGTSFSSNTLANGDLVRCEVLSSETCVTRSNALSNELIAAIKTDTLASVAIITPSATICAGQTVDFSAVVTNAGNAPTYNWTINGQARGNNRELFSSSNLSNGDVVSCVVTPGQNTCASKPVQANHIVMIINPLPTVELYPADTIVTPGIQVTFRTVINQDVQSFSWDPKASLENAQTLNPTTVPIGSESTFRLNIVSRDGCLMYKEAHIKPLYPFYVPNAFTPNGDGYNDLFRIPPFVDFVLADLQLFNRFGNQVFSTRDISKGWDGKVKGVDQPTGVYVYLIKGMLNGKVVVLKGYFTLLR